MKILISNDDGYRAPGIEALHAALRDIADVEVVAPEHNNSAKSNALTLHQPLYVHPGAEGVRYVNGTPADCVHIALTGLLGYRPDLVVSGINNGANMGDDTIYSGTVGAAMEGYLFGIPAIAFSQVEKGWSHLDAAARVARELVQQVLQTQYKAIGIEIVVKNEPARVMFGESLRKRSYKGAVMFMSDPPMDYVPIYVFHSEWIPTAANNWTGQNYMGFRSAGMDEALDAAWAELDPARRKALWKRILDIAAEEVPEVNLFFGAQAIVTPKWITGVVQPDRFGSPTTWIEDWTAR